MIRVPRLVVRRRRGGGPCWPSPLSATVFMIRKIGKMSRNQPCGVGSKVASSQQYRAQQADASAWRRARRPKTSKLAADPVLRSHVQRCLAQDWSPQQISHRLRREFPGDPRMRVSHETIYLSLFQQSRRALPKELRQHLRSGRTMRHPRLVKPPSGRGRIRDMVPITQRPADAESRSRLGHWECQFGVALSGPPTVTGVMRIITGDVTAG